MEDYYTFYVLILGLSEDLFWYTDIAFVSDVAQNKAAFDNYMNYQHEKINERNFKEKGMIYGAAQRSLR